MNGLRRLVTVGQQSCRVLQMSGNGARALGSVRFASDAAAEVPFVKKTAVEEASKSETELEHDRGMKGTISVVGPAQVGMVAVRHSLHCRHFRPNSNVDYFLTFSGYS